MTSDKKDPDVIEVVASGGIEVGGESKLRALMPNCGLLLKDVTYFLGQSKSNDEIGNRYARAAIIFMAFYLESLINLLIDYILNNINSPNRKKDYFKNKDKNPPEKFKDVYSFLYCDKLLLKCDISGIEDLFYRVRSQVIAHPRSYSITSGTDVPIGKGLRINGKEINYSKLKSLPNTLDNIKAEHAHLIYNEIKQFLSKYYDLVNSRFPEYLSHYFNLQ